MAAIYCGVVIKRDFFDEGVYRQMNALNVYQAQKQFEHSCELCVMKHKRMSCDVCPIKGAFEIRLEKCKSQNPRYYEKVRRFFIEDEP